MLGMDVLTCNVCIVPDINACSNFQIKNYVNFYLLQEHIHENLPSTHPPHLLNPYIAVAIKKVNVEFLLISRHTFLGRILSQLQLVDFLRKKKIQIKILEMFN
ncbi:hypothetical protein ACKWTF_004026 [Chironomus riparius]